MRRFSSPNRWSESRQATNRINAKSGRGASLLPDFVEPPLPRLGAGPLGLRFLHGELYFGYVGGRVIARLRPPQVDLPHRPDHAIAIRFDPGHQLAISSPYSLITALVDDTRHLLDGWQLSLLHPLPLRHRPSHWHGHLDIRVLFAELRGRGRCRRAGRRG